MFGFEHMPVQAHLREAVLDEHGLVAGMCRGEQRAFDQFFDTYAPRIAAFAARRASVDAAALEDVVQVTMIKAMRSVGGFRRGAGLFTWLCQICRNHLADLRRKAGRQPTLQSIAELEAASPKEMPAELMTLHDPLDESVGDSERRAVRSVLNRLPASHAQILELRYGDDLSVREIARVLQLSESATESRLVRARQAFRADWLGDTSALLN